MPAERRIPKIRIETRQAALLEGQRIVVAIDCWPRQSRYPQVTNGILWAFTCKSVDIYFSALYLLLYCTLRVRLAL